MTKDTDGNGGGVKVAVAVAVKSPTGRGSQRAVQWAAENLTWKADSFVLLHVMPIVTSIPTPSGEQIPIEDLDPKIVRLYLHDMKEACKKMFLPFKKLLKRRKVEVIVLEGDWPGSAILRYLSDSGISTVVVGSCSPFYGCFKRAKASPVPSIILNSGPPSWDIFVVGRRGVSQNTQRSSLAAAKSFKALLCTKGGNDFQTSSRQECLSSASSLKSRVDKHFGLSSTSRFNGPMSHASVQTSCTVNTGTLQEENHQNDVEKFSAIQSVNASSKQSNVEAELEQLRQELQSTLSMYNRTCEDLVYVQKKVKELSMECIDDEMRLDAVKKREESLRKVAGQEKEKLLEAMKEIEMAKSQFAKEANEREIAESNALKEFSEKQKIFAALFTDDKRYRRYTIDEIEKATGFFSEENLIGWGAYGKVYKCNLDHTPVAIKILRSEASGKKEEFLKEVEVLSQLHHPNIVLLLGACPEIGCLVYEYMENGSLDDYILKGSSQSPLPWFIRFQIVYEVSCGLAFLHNSGPEPIVHRDLKPGNILLGKNYVSKIGDVGLAKIISDLVPDNVTEYGNSEIAGTLSYMDPEYQRTGTVRPKSDLYALGVISLQLLTACHPNGLVFKVEKAMKAGSLADVLDKSLTNWPFAQVEELAQVALKCCKLRCRDRPDLETEVLPVLKRLAGFADAARKGKTHKFTAPSHFYCPIIQEVMEEPYIADDGFTYERIAIKTWLDRYDISPVTKQELQNKTLTPNHILRSAIQEWRSV